MKKYMIPLFLALSAYILTNCSKNEDVVYYNTLGIISINYDSTIIYTDDYQRLLVNNPASILATILNGNRVFVTYTNTNQALPAGIDGVIDIYYIEKIAVKPVIELIPEIADSIGNDPLSVTSWSLSRDFLNLNVKVYGGEKAHYISLIRYPGAIPVDTVDLEIRHNNNSDPGQTSLEGFFSFDLSSLQNDVADSVVLRIKAKVFGSTTMFTQNVTYKY
jgi:hypothetical protein